MHLLHSLFSHKQAVKAQNTDAHSTLADTVSKCDDTTAITTTGATEVITDTAALACSDDAETLATSSKSSSQCSWWIQSVPAQERFQQLLAAVRNAQVCNAFCATLDYQNRLLGRWLYCIGTALLLGVLRCIVQSYALKCLH
jgi:hypothetical protein